MRTSLALAVSALGCFARATAECDAEWPSSGCLKQLPSGEKPGQVYNKTIVSNGLLRSYLVFIPPKYKPNPLQPHPTIFSYHGGVQTAQDQLELDLFTSPYFNNESMVVYPQGINDTWEIVPGVTTNDVYFTKQIIDAVSEDYCIDLLRLGATGKSDGAGFVGSVAACDPDLSARFSAVAPVSGAFYVDNKTACNPETIPIPCKPSRAVPMFEFHGGNDTVINYEGGGRKDECLPSIPHWATAWAVRDGLNPKNTSKPLAQNATLFSWGQGYKTGLVQQVTDYVIGHDWPSTQPNADNTHAGHHVASFNATPMIIDFFRQNPLTRVR